MGQKKHQKMSGNGDRVIIIIDAKKRGDIPSFFSVFILIFNILKKLLLLKFLSIIY